MQNLNLKIMSTELMIYGLGSLLVIGSCLAFAVLLIFQGKKRKGISFIAVFIFLVLLDIFILNRYFNVTYTT